jgi:hypothetical protein
MTTFIIYVTLSAVFSISLINLLVVMAIEKIKLLNN